VQVLRPPQEFERPPFWNGCRYGITNYGSEVTFNGMTEFHKNIPIASKADSGETHRMMISLPTFEEGK
jgi:hypothetical protein